MSFSENIKNEIISNINSKYIKAETFGENITNLKKKNELDEEYEKYLDIANISENEIKNILKGVFLSTGSISDPNKSYHLEVIFKNKSFAMYCYNLLSLLEMKPNLVKRDVGKNSNYYVVYVKEADSISMFLSVIEANSSMLEFEKIRVEKDVANNINRNTNCEAANLKKVAKSVYTQMDAIKKIKENNKYETLDEKLKEFIKIREENPYDSMDTLAKKIGISKSGLKHRIDKIIEISK